ncbi:hypothetical protein ScPMuIL_008518 [Solemya velum]
MPSDLESLNMNDRDPHSINDHLAVQFEDVLGEPDGTHSIPCVWKNSYWCFNLWKSLCYTIMTTLCGICLAMNWGCEFAYISFVHIWYVTPLFKILQLNCGCLQRLYGMCISCCLEPLCTSIGMVFHQFGNGKKPETPMVVVS